MTDERLNPKLRFLIRWDAERAGYYVGIPNYNGGEVVDAQSYDATAVEIARLRDRITELETNAVDAHQQIDAIRKQAALDALEIVDRHRHEWIRPSEGAGPLPACSHACHLIAAEIRERFGLEGK